MKRKHYATAAIIIVLISVMAAGFEFVRRLDKGAFRQPVSFLKLPVTTAVPGPEDLRKIEQLEPIMARLAQPRERDKSAVQLGLFGYRPFTGGRQRATGNKIILPPEMNYSLTFAFLAGKKRFCIINGRFFEEGASLSDGGTITKIEGDRVLIKKQKVAKWVILDTAAGIKGKNKKDLEKKSE